MSGSPGAVERMVGRLRRHKQACFSLAVIAAYAVAFAFTDGLHQDLYKDEKHFWETTLLFVEHDFPPTLHQLRTYPEVLTPLTFTVWGLLERTFEGGIFVGRLLNLALGIAVLFIIGLRRDPDDDALLAACGLLLYPYFVSLSVFLYTDIPAIMLMLLGIWLYVHERPLSSAILLALAISARQYMLMVPVALSAWALVSLRRRERISALQCLAPMAASATIFIWFAIFGGMGPPSGLDKWVPLFPAPMMDFFHFILEYGLYFLTTVGVYFVVPEFFLFRRWRGAKTLLTPRNLTIAVALALLFRFYPPMTYTNPMGALDRVVRSIVSDDFVRMTVFYLFSLCTCLRFTRVDLSFWLLLVSFLINMKAQLAWEKYALPTITVLWYLKSIHALDGGTLLQRRRGGRANGQ